MSEKDAGAVWLPDFDAVMRRMFGGNTHPDLTIGFTGAELNRANELICARIRALEDALKAADAMREAHAGYVESLTREENDMRRDLRKAYDAARALTKPARRKL